VLNAKALMMMNKKQQSENAGAVPWYSWRKQRTVAKKQTGARGTRSGKGRRTRSLSKQSQTLTQLLEEMDGRQAGDASKGVPCLVKLPKIVPTMSPTGLERMIAAGGGGSQSNSRRTGSAI
jgi:hypothetical protein